MDKKDENLFEKVNKLSLPATILIGCIILGGFYYFSEANKQASIERQHQADLQQKQAEQQAIKEQNDLIANEKADCVNQATQNAVDYYKSVCTYDCKAGTYYTATYDSQYNECLESKGLK